MFCQIEGGVWPIAVEELAVVTNWLAGLWRLTNVIADRRSRF
jgi:hypothetical protein